MTESGFGGQLWTAFQDLAQSIATVVPRIVVGLILALVAWLVAKGLEKLLRTVCRRLGLDTLVQHVGIDRALGRLGVHRPLSDVVPRTTYYLLLFLFARTAADSLGLTAISSAIGAFLGYLPNLVAALLILVAASVIAPLAGGAITRAAAESGVDYASSLGRVVSAVIFFVLGIMAVGQLQIDTEIVRLVIGALLGGGAVAFGLSLGLGTREFVRNVIAGFYARKIFEIGRAMEIRGEQGVLRSITPTQTVLDQEGRIVALSNSAFLEEVVKQDAPRSAM